MQNLMEAIRLKVYEKLTPLPHKRFVMKMASYEEFPVKDDRDKFIKTQLQNRGFDLNRPIEQYRGMNNLNVIFEQF